jgi:hypothetical protein
MQDRRITTTLLAERLEVGKDAAKQILYGDLQKREILSRYMKASGFSESVYFCQTTEPGVPGDGKFHNHQLVNIK